jgi:hypothetical protein
MNLGKLLAAGKSIISSHVTDRYRTNKQVYLPKFANPANPFKPQVQSAPVPVSTPKVDAALVGAKTRPLPTLAMPLEKTEKTEKSEKTALSGWVSKISAVSVWSGWKAEVKAQQPAVQSELSLESVKVIHNDLSDADVEMVPIKSRPAPAPRKELTGEETSWELVRAPLTSELKR